MDKLSTSPRKLLTRKILVSILIEINLSASKTQRDEICMAAIRAALNAYGILREREAILYDNAALLFSSQDLAEELKPVRFIQNSLRKFVEFEHVPCQNFIPSG